MPTSRKIRPLRVLVLIVFLAIGLVIALMAANSATDNRQHASTGTGTALYSFTPHVPTGQSAVAGKQSMAIAAHGLGQSLLDGFQLSMTVSGTIPTDMKFYPSDAFVTQYHLQSLGGTLQKNSDGTGTFRIAFISSDPQQPIQPQQDGTMGSFGDLRFTVPSGKTTLTFDAVYSKILQHTTSQDLLAVGITDTGSTFVFDAISFGPVVPATATPVPTPTPTPTIRPTATPVVVTPSPTTDHRSFLERLMDFWKQIFWGQHAPISSQQQAPVVCRPSGCSNTICADPGTITSSTCEYKAFYACYRFAVCEKQANGHCGWTHTAQFTACMSGF